MLFPLLLIAAGIKCILLYSGGMFLFFGAVGAFFGIPWVLPAVGTVLITLVAAGVWYWRRKSARDECPIPMSVLRLMKRGKEPDVARLVKADPAPNSSMDRGPGELRLWFGAPLQPTLSQVTVVAADGSKVDVARSTVDDADPNVMRVAMPELNPGTYTVHWRTMASATGQSAGGQFRFTIGEPVGVLTPSTAS